MNTPSYNNVVLEPGVRVWSIVFDEVTANTGKVLITEFTDNFKMIKYYRVSNYSMLRLVHVVSESPNSGAFRTYLNGALSVLVVLGVEHAGN